MVFCFTLHKHCSKLTRAHFPMFGRFRNSKLRIQEGWWGFWQRNNGKHSWGFRISRIALTLVWFPNPLASGSDFFQVVWGSCLHRKSKLRAKSKYFLPTYFFLFGTENWAIFYKLTLLWNASWYCTGSPHETVCCKKQLRQNLGEWLIKTTYYLEVNWIEMK